MDVQVAKVTDFYNHLSVAVLELSGELNVGDEIIILGKTTELTQIVYLDFCDKYRVEATSPKSQAQFLDKLREKKQADWQIEQATHAVSLYWDVQRALKARPTASTAESLSKAAEAAKPYRLPAEVPKKQIAGKEKGSQKGHRSGEVPTASG